jgi:hypothetical protein
MDRKLIRPSLAARPSSASAPARRSVPESTHAEAGYLQQAIESEAVFVVQLLGEGELRGRLEGYDRDVLMLARDGQPSLVLRKERIRAYWVERKPAEAPTP